MCSSSICRSRVTLCHRQIGHTKRIDEHDVWQGNERENRSLHRAQRRLMDVDAIDLGRIGLGDSPRDRVGDNALVEALTLDRSDKLGVTDSRNVAIGMQHHGRRDHRSRQAAAANLIDTCYMHESDATQRILQRAHRRDASHTLREVKKEKS